jgi:hypothetical protein
VLAIARKERASPASLGFAPGRSGYIAAITLDHPAQEDDNMPRILVSADSGPEVPRGPMLLDQKIRTNAVDDREASTELIERPLGALVAAEEVQRPRRAFAPHE